MEINQKLIVARDALYEKDYTTLAKLVVENQVGGDSVVSEYILQHENGLFVLQDKFWLQFEKEIIELENLEVTMSDLHKEYARQYIKYGADIIDNNPELSWRLWLCLWIVGLKSEAHATTVLSFIMEKNSVGAYTPETMRGFWIIPQELRSTDDRDCVLSTIVFRFCPFGPSDVIRAFGDWSFWNIPQALDWRAELQSVTVQTCVQMLQQVCLRPPDRVMQLLNMPRFTSPIGTEV